MPSAGQIFLFLLLPVTALLFLNLRLSRRIDYPHELLASAGRKGPAAFLFRSFRTWYDVLLDALIALILSFALASSWPAALDGNEGTRAGYPAWSRSAVVIDCSASMLLGYAGSRPLDLALAQLAENDNFKGAKAFALAFDAATATTRLFPLAPIIEGTTGESAAIRLTHSLAFMDLDYRALRGLRDRGYGRISLLTDQLAFTPRGFDAIELGFQGGGRSDGFVAYPASVRYDREAGTWLISFVQSLAPGLIRISAWNEGLGRFENLAADSYRIEPRESGWNYRLSQPGLYLVGVAGPGGQSPSAFAFRLVEAREAAESSGPFSSAMMAVFPLLQAAPRPAILFLDSGEGKAGSSKAAARSPNARRIESLIVGRGAELYLPPSLSLGRPILAAAPDAGGPSPIYRGGIPEKDYSFVLGPESLANEDLPLVYDSAILAGQAPAFITSPPSASPGLVTRAGQLFAKDAYGLIPLNPPPSEFFAAPRRGSLALEPVHMPRIVWAILLALAGGAKLLVYRKTSGKRLLS